MNIPFLSLALAVYARWDDLEKVLTSLLPQLNEETELVISDNASPNGMADKIAEFCAGHANVRLLRQSKNVGPLLNYLAAIDACRGKYVICLADDDFPTPRFVRFVLDTLRAHPDTGAFHFEPNPFPGRPISFRKESPGLHAALLIYAYSGMISGVTFRRDLFERHLWTPAPDIYPQVHLATTIARDAGSVLASGPEGLILGGVDDTSVNRARSRPDDFGIGERLVHLCSITRGMPRRERLKAMNCGVLSLTYWGWGVFDEMWGEDQAVAKRFVNALTRIDHVRTSPYMILTWIRLVGRSSTLWRSAPWVVPAALRGTLTSRFWNILLNWRSMKVRDWGRR